MRKILFVLIGLAICSFLSNGFADSFAFPDTGQTESYDNKKERIS